MNNDYIDMRMEELDRAIDKGQIDKFLIPLIKLLNEKGFITNFCCSGLFKEHKKDKYFKRHTDIMGLGYIAFDRYLSFEEKMILEDIAYSCYLSFEESSMYRMVPIYDIEKKEHFMIEEETTALNSCTIRGRVPEFINCNDRRKITKKLYDEITTYKWNLLYEKIEKLK